MLPRLHRRVLLRLSPKFPGHKYPFRDLCGAGVAFKLVQALQTELDGLPDGYEKWLLDLVALGTVCDIVSWRMKIGRMSIGVWRF